MNANPTLGPTFLLATILFLIGCTVEKRLPRAFWWIGAALAIPCVLAILYYFHLFDRAVWYYEARALRYTDFTFAGVGFLGGVAYRWQVPETWRARVGGWPMSGGFPDVGNKIVRVKMADQSVHLLHRHSDSSSRACFFRIRGCPERPLPSIHAFRAHCKSSWLHQCSRTRPSEEIGEI